MHATWCVAQIPEPLYRLHQAWSEVSICRNYADREFGVIGFGSQGTKAAQDHETPTGTSSRNQAPCAISWLNCGNT